MSEPSLADKCAFLSRPEAYANASSDVTVRETHMSYVFLTNQHAWKMKKPVRESYLDFSTLERRRSDCEREVCLNRRLTEGVYLGTAPLTMTSDGGLRLEGDGRVVEWLVKMRRLPDAKMLDRAIASQSVTREDTERVGTCLVRFYKSVKGLPTFPSKYSQQLHADVIASANELLRFNIPNELVNTVSRSAVALMEEHRSAIEGRASTLVDAHGDLRPEHICLEPEPVIIDCLEFCDDLRILDPVSELSYFSLECDRLGAPWIGERVFDVYQRGTGDRPPSVLFGFYKRQHALTRAKIAVWHLKDPGNNNPLRWRAKAVDYLERASRLQ